MDTIHRYIYRRKFGRDKGVDMVSSDGYVDVTNDISL